MRQKSQKSPEQQRLDALWRAYINSDPDLRRFYQKQRMIKLRRRRKMYIRLYRSTWPVGRPNKALEVAGMAASSFVAVALIGAMLIYL